MQYATSMKQQKDGWNVLMTKKVRIVTTEDIVADTPKARKNIRINKDL